MDFRFGGELPDDHVFFSRIRPLVEGVFKLISWLIITATLGVAAELTSNGWLWAMYGACHLLLILFLQTFFNWLFLMQFPDRPKRQQKPISHAGFRQWLFKARTMLVASLAFMVWIGFQIAIQQAIGHAVTAVADFQKVNFKTPS